MRTRMRFHAGWILVLAMPWILPPVVSGHSQEPTEGAVRPQPSEGASTSNKPRTLNDPLDVDMQAFSVTLLLGELQGTSAAENVPEAARKALADVREFLPYKSYRLLDTQWIRCCAGSTIEGRLRGLDEQYYSFSIVIQSVSGSKMAAHFSLADAAVDAAFTPGKKRMMSSGFSMETGETIVIGTSSLKGDKALVVLLTAVPRSPVGKTKKGSVK